MVTGVVRQLNLRRNVVVASEQDRDPGSDRGYRVLRCSVLTEWPNPLLSRRDLNLWRNERHEHFRGTESTRFHIAESGQEGSETLGLRGQEECGADVVSARL